MSGGLTMNTISKLLFVLLLFCSAQVFAAVVTVNITNFQFSSNSITINAGDSVKWVNNDTSFHTTTSDTAGLWDSGFLANGTSFTHVFKTAGTFKYHCGIHSTMTATIIVRSLTIEQTRIEAGKTLAPTQLNLVGKNANLAYLGSYIVNAQAGCANCHSCPTYKVGNNPYLGQPKKFNPVAYLAGGVKVSGGGVMAVSANLTPDATGKPASLTLTAFKNLLRTGKDPDVPNALLPVMPWPIFGSMSDHDLTAVYEYLRAIPAAATPATLCEQPGQ
jgi:plastocyanin